MQKPEPCFVRCSAAVSRKQQLKISPRRSFLAGALLYSSANSQYDSVWCKVLSSKDDDKVRKIFSREIV